MTSRSAMALSSCDGGPLDIALSNRIGLPVLHRISLEHGMLQPLGAGDPFDVELAPDQFAAVVENGATARVIAPAGSGKTRVLTERARLLLGGWGLPPSAVVLSRVQQKGCQRDEGAPRLCRRRTGTDA